MHTLMFLSEVICIATAEINVSLQTVEILRVLYWNGYEAKEDKYGALFILNLEVKRISLLFRAVSISGVFL